jgi:hypothetical protein
MRERPIIARAKDATRFGNTMGLIESTFPAAGKLVDPCKQCGRAEGVWSVPWPDVPTEEFHLLCGRCMWRKFHDVPKGNLRRELIRKVFKHRVTDRPGR